MSGTGEILETLAALIHLNEAMGPRARAKTSQKPTSSYQNQQPIVPNPQLHRGDYDVSRYQRNPIADDTHPAFMRNSNGGAPQLLTQMRRLTLAMRFVGFGKGWIRQKRTSDIRNTTRWGKCLITCIANSSARYSPLKGSAASSFRPYVLQI